MKQQIVLVHGGTAFSSYEDFLSSLHSRKVSLEDLQAKGWKQNLQERLGSEFEVIALSMPNKLNAKYLEWEIWFNKYLPFLHDDVILIGHSLGGIFLAKYLSENKLPVRIRATIFVAAVFNQSEKLLLADFVLPADLHLLEEQGGEIIFMHSKDDLIVEFSHVESYQKLVPSAQIVQFEDKGHFCLETFPELEEIVRDISSKT